MSSKQYEVNLQREREKGDMLGSCKARAIERLVYLGACLSTTIGTEVKRDGKQSLRKQVSA